MIGRISGRRAFQALADPDVPGERVRASTLWCRYVDRIGDDTAAPVDAPAAAVGVAFAIGRRCGPAVVRNRLRRRLRVLVGEATERYRVAGGAMLIGARPEATTLAYTELGNEVDALFVQLFGSESRS